MRILDLFAGIGGFSLAGHWAGHETVAFVEKDPFCQQVLKKNFGGVPIYGDIKEFDGTKYTGAVDIICGGFPCQPFSVAGKRKGTDDDRHLWPQMLRVIREVKPTWVIGENVGGFITIGGGMVFEQTCVDLEEEGYEVQAFIIPAVAVNAPHRRDRVWIIAHAVSDADRARSGEISEEDGIQSLDRSKMGSWEFIGADNDIVINSNSKRECARPEEVSRKDGKISQWNENAESGNTNQFDKTFVNTQRSGQSGDTRGRTGSELENGHIRDEQYKKTIYNANFERDWIEVAATLCGADDGLPARVDGFELSKSGHRRERLKSLGNSIVPQVAYEIFKAINEVIP